MYTFFLSFLLLFSFGNAGLFQKYVFKLNSIIGYCEGYGTLPMGMENISLTTDNSRVTLIDALYVLREDLTSKYEEEITLTKCNSKESPDSCVNFKTLKFPDVCPLYLAKNQAWSPFFENMEPKLTCPMRKGVYTLKKGYFDISKMPMLVDANNYWKIHVRNKDLADGKIVFCIDLEGQLVPMKKD